MISAMNICNFLFIVCKEIVSMILSICKYNIADFIAQSLSR